MRTVQPGQIPHVDTNEIPPFDRRFFESDNLLSRIGSGSIGGKATGLVFAHAIVKSLYPDGTVDGMTVNIPRFVVLGTDVYDAFLRRNDLASRIDSEMPDDRIAMLFQRAEFPAQYAGDIRGLIGAATTPLAVRSSSLLEDALFEPLAGVYGTKMIPNNQADTDTRYKKLIEAIKFVYATVFFCEARGYHSMINRSTDQEKMSVIIQEVVGMRHGDRFYPDVSGVGRSFNFYPIGSAKPEEGVVDLAFGLGKTIVDGGRAWTYSPARPTVAPPFTTRDLLHNTQTDFWAVHMGKPPAYDPVRESEYLIQPSVNDAEPDGTLSSVASTYISSNDRVVMGVGNQGPRILNFAPLLSLNTTPYNAVVRRVLTACEKTLGSAVEIEFALSLSGNTPRFGLLQVRPMVVSTENIELDDSQMQGDHVLLASASTLGNGEYRSITQIVYVKPDSFEKRHTQRVAADIDAVNRAVAAEGGTYILIGFGRWGSADPWLGIPVNWGSISRARAIVEATLPDMNVELSQGSHFFHNITNLQIPYFCVPFDGEHRIDWGWLHAQDATSETEFVRCVKLDKPLIVRLDGRSRRGVILK